MANRSQLATPDSISGQQNIATPYADLQPQAKPYSAYQGASEVQVHDAPKANGYTQLANALAEIQPTLNQSVAYVTDLKNKEDIGEASFASNKAAQDRNIKDLKQAMDAGLLPAGASPIYIKAWKENFLKLRGEQAENLMRQDYMNNAELRNSDDPEAYNKWASKWRQDYMTGVLGENQFTGQEVANSKVNELVQHSIMQINGEHINWRVGERERMGRETASDLAQKRLDYHFDNRDFFQTNWAAAAKDLADVWYDKDTGFVTAGGVRGSHATEDMTEAIITNAVSKGRLDILDVANHIQTPGGTLAGTKVWREKADAARRHIAGEKYQEMMRQDAVDKLEATGTREERIAHYKDLAAKGKADIVRERLTREMSADIYLHPTATPDDVNARNDKLKELYQVNPEAAAQVQNTVQRMEEHAKTEHRTRIHDEAEAVIRQDILNNPLNPGHEDRIIAAFRHEIIDRDQMRSMLGFVQSYRQAGESHSALKDPAYIALEKGVYAGVVKDMAKVGGYEAISATKAQWDFRSEALAAIQADPKLSKNGPALAAMMEKRLQPIAERYNKELVTLRKSDEEKQKFNEYLLELDKKQNAPTQDQKRETDLQVEKAKEFDKRMKAFDAGQGPDPRGPQPQQDATKPVTPTKPVKKAPTVKELADSLTSDEKKTLSNAFDRTLLPAIKEKGMTPDQLRDTVRNVFRSRYGDDAELNKAVTDFIETFKKSKRYAKQ